MHHTACILLKNLITYLISYIAMSEPIGLDWFCQVTCLSLLLSWLERFEKDFSALVVIAFWIYWLLTWLSHAQIQGTRVLVGIKYEWVWFIMFQLPKSCFLQVFCACGIFYHTYFFRSMRIYYWKSHIHVLLQKTLEVLKRHSVLIFTGNL